MKNSKLPVIILAIVILFGGSFYAYNTLSTREPQSAESDASGSPEQAQPEPDSSETPDEQTEIKAPDFKVFDADGNEVFSQRLFRSACCNKLLGKLVSSVPC